MSKKPNLEYVVEFIKLVLDPEPMSSERFATYARIFVREGEGTLALSQKENRAYRSALARLIEDFGKSEEVSNFTIEKEFQRAIFSAVDIPKKRMAASPEDRVRNSINELRVALTKEVMDYECYIPIRGVEPESLPFRMGGVKFQKFTKVELQKIECLLKNHKVSDQQIKIRRDSLFEAKDSDIWDSPCAVVKVAAKDSDGALTVARRQVRATMDILNFFTDLIPYNYGWLYFPEEANPVRSLSLMVKEDTSVSMKHAWRGPAQNYSLTKLRETKFLKSVVSRLGKLLSNRNSRDIDNIFLSAFQWAGRATVESRREEAFLLFAIALESIILPSTDPTELGYRLRMRIAHLLGSSIPQRREIAKDVADLYSIRSRIVHDGYYQVSESDLEKIRTMVKQSLVILAKNRKIARMNDKKELDQWFESQVLA